jgi:uncharacterized delta-60 repeat protein
MIRGVSEMIVISGPKTRRGALRTALTLLVATASLAVLVAAAGAESATEATTFGADGVASPSLGVNYARTSFTDVTARPDGGVVARRGPQLLSFLADGAPDPAAPPSPAPEGETFPAAGGKTFVLSKGTLTRLDPDGTADLSFGEAGTAKVPDSTRGVVELASGKVVAVTIEGMGARDFQIYAGVTVLNADGSEEQGVPGSSQVVPQDYLEWPIREFVPTPDGGALVVADQFMLALGPDGSANASFGKDGVLTGSHFAGARILPDGTIEAAATSYISGGEKEEPTILEYTAAGAPETSFGDKGRRGSDVPNWSAAETASWGADGSVILGGRTATGGSCTKGECVEAPALVAFDPSGNIERGFGEGGLLRLSALAGRPDGYSSSGVLSLARRPDGSIVAAGNARPNESVAFLAAFSAQGALLGSFGEGGIVPTREAVPATLRLAGLVPLAGQELLGAGYSDVGIEEHPVLVRFAADGSLDPSFGEGTGFVNLGGRGRVSGVALYDGRAAVVSPAYPRSHLFLARVAGGAPVSSFGSGGTALLPRGMLPEAVAFALRGEPVVVGNSQGPRGHQRVPILRFSSDGRLDPTFGQHGTVTLRPPGGGELKGRSIIEVPGNRMVVGALSGDRFALAGLLPDGRLDPRFGKHGWSLTPRLGQVRSLKMVRAGFFIYLAGLVTDGKRHSIDLMRFDDEGHLDRRFGKGGIRTATTESRGDPTAVLPSTRGVVVTLERGPQPVLVFAKGGAVRQRRVAKAPTKGEDVTAAFSGRNLVVGWTPYEERLSNSPEYHLSSTPLGRLAAAP